MVYTTINDVPVSCLNQAAVSNHVPAALLLAIMKKENGRNGEAVRNKNNSYDLGVFQINTRWLPVLARYGYTRDDIQWNPCKNVMAGSWILAMSLADGKTAWSGIGNYHSHTLRYNKPYSVGIQYSYQKIIQILKT